MRPNIRATSSFTYTDGFLGIKLPVDDTGNKRLICPRKFRKAIPLGTKNEPGRFDCYGAAEPNEPIFVLLGRDPDAPALVREWARLRSARPSQEGDKIMEALDCAANMEAFRMARASRPQAPVVLAEDE